MILSVPLIVIGAATAIIGRHSVLGLCIGCGMMLAGWVNLEIKEARS